MKAVFQMVEVQFIRIQEISIFCYALLIKMNQLNQGGAILINEAEGSISDTNFTGNLNSGSNGGGALFIENSSPIITRSRFLSNTTDANNHGGDKIGKFKCRNRELHFQI